MCVYPCTYSFMCGYIYIYYSSTYIYIYIICNDLESIQLSTRVRCICKYVYICIYVYHIISNHIISHHIIIYHLCVCVLKLRYKKQQQKTKKRPQFLWQTAGARLLFLKLVIFLARPAALRTQRSRLNHHQLQEVKQRGAKRVFGR